MDSEKILEPNDILIDTHGHNWLIGHMLGKGGNGEVYAACNMDDQNMHLKYKYAIKIVSINVKKFSKEILENPFHLQANASKKSIRKEINFYKTYAQPKQILGYKIKRNMTRLGMPHYIRRGEHYINEHRYFFFVIQRYGRDIQSYLKEYIDGLPEHTIYKIAINMLDVFEFLHLHLGLVHGDFKGGNILTGFEPEDKDQVFLVDFGSFYPINFEEDLHRSGNGTWIYKSRDNHKGCCTFRGDLETMGYNLLRWLKIDLPWITQPFCKDHLSMLPIKIELMKNTEHFLTNWSRKPVPKPVLKYFQYVASLQMKDTPNYKECKSIFINALKDLGMSNVRDLQFSSDKTYTMINLKEIRHLPKAITAESKATIMNKDYLENNLAHLNEIHCNHLQYKSITKF